MISGKPIYHILIKKYNLIFTAIPKNANTSMKYSLIKTFYPDSLQIIDEIVKKQNNDLIHSKSLSIFDIITNEQYIKSKDYKIAIIRNPFDRLFSGWVNKIKNLDTPRFGFTKKCNFKEFLIQICNTPDNELNRHFAPQYLFICNENHSIIPNRILRFEILDIEWKALQKYLNNDLNINLTSLPFLNNDNIIIKNYKQYYTKELIDLVYKKFEKDLELFSYEF